MSLQNAHRAFTGKWQALASGSVNKRIFGAAVIVGALTGGVSLLTVARDLIIAAKFGTSDAIDAFLIAYLLPTYVISILAGSFRPALIPTYVSIREHGHHEEAQRTLASIVAISIGLLAAVTVLLALSGPFLLPLVGSGFSPDKLRLTQQLYYLLLPAILASGLVSIWGPVLNAWERFAVPALSPVIVPLCVIAALYVMGAQWGVFSVAVGTVVGFALQAVALGFVVKKQGILAWPRWHGMSPPVRRIIGQYAPMLVGACLLSSTLLVDQSFAASLGSGSVAALGYGNKIVVLILTLGTTALRTAVLPYFSKLTNGGEWKALRHTLRTYTFLVFSVATPIMIGLIYFSTPLAHLLYQRGAFTSSDAEMVGNLQEMFALQIPFFTYSSLIAPLLSSLHENRVMLQSAAITLVLDIVLDYTLIQFLGVAGIALATSAMYTVMGIFQALYAYRIIARREHVERT